MEEKPILVGEIAAPFGIRGEVKLLPLLARPELLVEVPAVQIEWPDGRRESRRVLALRHHQQALLVRFDGVDRNGAEALRGAQLYLPTSAFPPLGPDEYYQWQLLGLQVVTEAGRDLGTIERVHFYPANDVYETPVALIPAVADFVVSVDLEAGRLTVRDVPGLRKDE